MSLFGTLQLASNSLQAQQIGLQVVGNNIANANTPGYAKENVLLTPAPTARQGSVLIGLGVEVEGITQQVNSYLEQQLRTANSDQSNAQTQASTYSSLEGVLNALGTTNLDTSLTNFTSSISDVLNSPQDTSMLNLAVLKGQSLASNVNSLAGQVSQMRSDLDQQVQGDVQTANQLITQIGTLNTQISALEGGAGSTSQATSLRDQRTEALTKLSQLVSIRTQDQPDGSTNVYAGGDYLVFEGQTNQLATLTQTNRGTPVSQVVIQGNNSPLPLEGGEIAGLVASRDTILGGFTDQLNQFAGTLADEFNKIYSSGQGLSGYSTLTSTNSVADAAKPLEDAGLPFTPVSGSFNVQVYDTQTGQTQTTTIPVVLNGLNNDDTTLDSLAQSLNAVSGISATVSSVGQLTIASTSPNLTFSFGSDSSGTLAALGLNTFFTGSTAADLGVNQEVVNDPSTFAASQSGIGGNTANAVQMAGFINQPLDSANGLTITQLNDQIVSNVTEQSSNAQAVATGTQSYQTTLQNQEMSTSGVSLDEEAIQMISYQQAYQASAKFISTISQLLTTLTQL